jgi:hypothetical protein
MRYTPMSLRKLGMRPYLDSTALAHNGFDYNDFCVMYNAHVNPANIARAFNVRTRETIVHWIKIYKEELNKKKDI